MSSKLFEKYDVPVPRYTSYPAVPNWKNNLTSTTWLEQVRSSMQKQDVSWSLYMHLPFCESLCTFCACNNVITRDHTKEDRYIEAIHKEWDIYIKSIPELKTKKIRQLHLGGGSPTFFSSTNLKKLLAPFFATLKIDMDLFEGAIEVDPRRCTYDQLKVLKDFGFNRISLGVQDFDIEVQKNVNRIQPFEMVQKCVDEIRSLNYPSINFDLIYGLPGQTEESIRDTATKTVLLRPDRIALYSLAVVPWLRPAQNRFQRMETKKGYDKRRLFEIARDVFLEAGYISLGIDHFALPSDAIAISNKNKSLHRNFMGYTEYGTDVLLGLGVSAISETPISFHQNHKVVDEYYQSLEVQGVLPTSKGHVLTGEDREIKDYILDLMTNHHTQFKEGLISQENFTDMIDEDIVRFDKNNLIVTNKGIPFTRHVCQRVDRYAVATSGTPKFSSGV